MGPHVTEAGALLGEPAHSPPPTLALPPAQRSPEAQLCWELVTPPPSPPQTCLPSRSLGLEQGLTSAPLFLQVPRSRAAPFSVASAVPCPHPTALDLGALGLQAWLHLEDFFLGDQNP